MLSKPEKQTYLSLRCVCLWEKSEPALVVWARSCQCVLVQSGNMRQNPNRIPTAHFLTVSEVQYFTLAHLSFLIAYPAIELFALEADEVISRH